MTAHADQWMKLVIMCYAMLIQANHKLQCDNILSYALAS